MRFNLSAWALQHRTLTLLAMIVLAVGGTLSYLSLGRAEDPAFTIKTMVIQTRWPGATVDETLEQVTDRIEKKLEELDSLDYVKSYTRPGESTVFVYLRDTTSAGRHPDSDIFLDDVTVSRRHAEFRRDGAEFVVVDVGSLNGTYVNREPVDTAVLANGDEVQIGKFRLVFVAGPRPDES